MGAIINKDRETSSYNNRKNLSWDITYQIIEPLNYKTKTGINDKKKCLNSKL